MEPVPYAVLTDPQSLNLYAYVRNNPMTQVDPDGHFGDNVYWVELSSIYDQFYAFWYGQAQLRMNSQPLGAQQTNTTYRSGQVHSFLKVV